MKDIRSVNPMQNRSNQDGKTVGGISELYQEWKTAQMEQEDNELLQMIKTVVLGEKPLSMFVELHISNILLWGVEKVRNEMVSSWQNQVV